MKKLIALVMLFGCGVAQGFPLVWTVDTVWAGSFGAGTLKGSFVYDDATGQMTELNLVTRQTSQDINPPFLETTFTSIYSGGRNGLYAESDTFFWSDITIPLVATLRLDFSQPLTDAGGEVAINSTAYLPGIGWYLTSHMEVYTVEDQERYLGLAELNGVATAVPVPAAVWLFMSGLGLLGWLRRRQVA